MIKQFMIALMTLALIAPLYSQEKKAKDDKTPVEEKKTADEKTAIEKKPAGENRN